MSRESMPVTPHTANVGKYNQSYIRLACAILDKSRRKEQLGLIAPGLIVKHQASKKKCCVQRLVSHDANRLSISRKVMIIASRQPRRWCELRFGQPPGPRKGITIM